MILGQAAGTAASLAIKHNGTVQEVDYGELKRELLEASQVVQWGEDMVDDPIERMKETFGVE